MHKIIWLCFFLFLALPKLSFADSINLPSELSHAAGGALLAGGFTAVGDKYSPEHRKLIGFSASTALVLIGEGIQMAEGEEFSSSLQDIVAHVIGAGIGMFVTDKYFLMPVIKRDYVGDKTFTGLDFYWKW